MPQEVILLRLVERDDIPNNRLPALIYRSVLPGRSGRLERVFIEAFAKNGWGEAWINGIYDFHHFHPAAHEVLGIAAGWARVQLGGPDGPEVEVGAGDAVLIPAGVAHCCRESEGLSVVGAYPEGSVSHHHVHAGSLDPLKARHLVENVSRPACDPMFGRGGPMNEHWP